MEESHKSRGLGDSIKKITEFLGIEQCEGCKKRQEILNDLVPYAEPKAKLELTPEVQAQIEEMLRSQTKSSCNVLNNIRKELDGVFIDNCFCTLSARTAFIKDTKRWYESIKK